MEDAFTTGPVTSADISVLILHYLREQGFSQTADAFEKDAKDTIPSPQAAHQVRSLRCILNEFSFLKSEQQRKKAFFFSLPSRRAEYVNKYAEKLWDLLDSYTAIQPPDTERLLQNAVDQSSNGRNPSSSHDASRTELSRKHIADIIVAEEPPEKSITTGTAKQPPEALDRKGIKRSRKVARSDEETEEMTIEVKENTSKPQQIPESSRKDRKNLPSARKAVSDEVPEKQVPRKKQKEQNATANEQAEDANTLPDGIDVDGFLSKLRYD
eukprot:TRINITY_DN4663_c0_g1_i1.p1 TRINITY_DN4663_c0_g1~~TRINITY_DN4663_c0_g1_i1.p1  ORF type:complete len:269 (+),score=65.85 TRINITY_DN4663_c0_g1_i1:223-1029(+)